MTVVPGDQVLGPGDDLVKGLLVVALAILFHDPLDVLDQAPVVHLEVPCFHLPVGGIVGCDDAGHAPLYHLSPPSSILGPLKPRPLCIRIETPVPDGEIDTASVHL